MIVPHMSDQSMKEKIGSMWLHKWRKSIDCIACKLGRYYKELSITTVCLARG